MELKNKNLFEISNFLKDEFFSNNDDNWILQQQLIKFTEMQVALAVADEADKKNISLVGQKEVTVGKGKDLTTDPYQTVSLDPNCAACQCSNNVERSSLLQNLKLACLMY